MKKTEWLVKSKLFHEVINELVLSSSGIIIYGAGYNGIKTLIKLKQYNIPVICFCDANKQKCRTNIDGISIISPSELKKYPAEAFIIVSPDRHIPMIKKTLTNMGFFNIFYYTNSAMAYELESALYAAIPLSEKQSLVADNTDKINYVCDNLNDKKSTDIFIARMKTLTEDDYVGLSEYIEEKQYFPPDLISFEKGEVFVDCGAYNGETTYEFAKYAKDYEWIYTFEPEPIQFELTKAYIANRKIERSTVFEIAAYSSKGELNFSLAEDSSCVDETAEHTIHADSLDNILLYEKHKPTYIKMDIEGSELRALKGAKELIRQNNPRLAISVYHKPEDIWEIPYYIMTTHPGYKVYLRQHALFTETVMYAIAKNKN